MNSVKHPNIVRLRAYYWAADEMLLRWRWLEPLVQVFFGAANNIWLVVDGGFTSIKEILVS
uniref:Uncharacterized protein n=1 Tax=Nelumbo nucifera TaxID=4432 RepID=A0A822Y6B0_NELNU|nr:TPA_asm: hypothetical protein HUJ06_029031 [Nelumbo nucifera]